SRSHQTEEIRTSTDDVVLAEISVDGVGPAITLYIVVAVAGELLEFDEVDRTRRDVDFRAPVSLEGVVTKLAEDHIVARAACNAVCTVQVLAYPISVMKERYVTGEIAAAHVRRAVRTSLDAAVQRAVHELTEQRTGGVGTTHYIAAVSQNDVET